MVVASTMLQGTFSIDLRNEAIRADTLAVSSSAFASTLRLSKVRPLFMPAVLAADAKDETEAVSFFSPTGAEADTGAPSSAKRALNSYGVLRTLRRITARVSARRPLSACCVRTWGGPARLGSDYMEGQQRFPSVLPAERGASYLTRLVPRRVLVLKDFNSKPVARNSPRTNRRSWATCESP